MKRLIDLIKAAAKKFAADKASRLGAALAYYAVFSVAPVIVIAVGVAGLAIGEQAARGEIVDRLADSVGPESAAFLQDMIAGADGGGAAGAAVLGSLLALFGASTLAVHLRGALNVVWDVPLEETKGITGFLRARLVGIATVLVIGVLLIAVLVGGGFVAALDEILSEDLDYLDPLFQFIGPLLTVLLTAVTFAGMFRFVPAVHVRWRDALVGGSLTAVLYTLGSWLLSIYLGSGTVGAGFGAAAALVVLLVFVYYSAQIVLFGAEFTRVYGLAREEAVAAPVPATPSSPRRRRSVAPAPAGTLLAFLIGLAVGARRRR